MGHKYNTNSSDIIALQGAISNNSKKARNKRALAFQFQNQNTTLKEESI